MRRLIVWTTLLLLLVAATQPALADKRVALVIGNSTYQKVGRLSNPANDAADMAAAFKRLGFTVTLAENLTYDAMRRALRDFGNEALGADMAVVYYAGHGMELNHQNFLIPVDAHLATDLDVDYEAVPLDMVMGAVDRAKGLRLVLLDACRNNPFAASMKVTSSSRAIGRGLSRVEPESGTLVSFSAREGTVAADGTGRNSPYTKALLDKIEEPGLEVNFLFRQVRDEVLKETDGEQEPFTYGSLPGKQIYLKPPALMAQPGPQPNSTAVEFAYWNSVKDLRNTALLKAYREKYPQGQFAALADLMIQGIKAERERLAKAAALKATDEEAARKKAAEAAKAAVVASLDAGNQVPPPQDNSKPDFGLALQVQIELQRIGCDPGRPDGKWGANSQKALADYARYAKVRLANLGPSQQLLDDLRKRQSRACPLVCGQRFDRVGDKCVLKTCGKGLKLTASGSCQAISSTSQNSSIATSKSAAHSKQCGECVQARISLGTSLNSFYWHNYCGEQYLWRKKAGLCK